MLNIQRIPLERLRPAPYNPRVPLRPGMPGYERLRRSIEEFDLVQPIVWNERTGHVVSGHQRLEILKAGGEREIEVVVVSLPLEREQALNVALNNPNVGGAWDPGRLVELMRELVDVPAFDAMLTGFDADELRDLVLAPVEDGVLESFARTDGACRSGAERRGRRAAGDRRRRRDSAEPRDDVPLLRVVLEIPPDEWEGVRPRLDEIIGRFGLRVHVALPDDPHPRSPAPRSQAPPGNARGRRSASREAT